MFFQLSQFFPLCPPSPSTPTSSDSPHTLFMSVVMCIIKFFPKPAFQLHSGLSGESFIA